ncbi:MAG: hypothetical protein ACRC8M_03015 [Cetobacterium sp.]|uniref:hypothetical protein n=1 Tax=Cetobacterium sp. TaxID=2071632 RepID=UPI003F2C9E49
MARKKVVIVIVDMDGAYINEDAIKQSSEIQEFKYTETYILAPRIEKVVERNERKAKNLNVLSCLNRINVSLDYSLYYFSCNQEHVLHNLIGVPDNQKKFFAEKFNDQYEDNFDEFKDFIRSEEFAVKGSYLETWEFIKKDNNSLKRFSNIHLLLKEENL